MKRITPAILTAFSVLALSFSVTSFADNTDSDGFIVFEAQTTDVASQTASSEQASSEQASTESAVQAKEVVQAKPKAKKKVAKKTKKAKNKLRKRAKRAKRSVRKKRIARATRAQRSHRGSLRKASSYRIRRGDTLFRISVKSGVKLNRLVRLNKLHGSKKHNIQAGQKIRLR